MSKDKKQDIPKEIKTEATNKTFDLNVPEEERIPQIKAQLNMCLENDDFEHMNRVVEPQCREWELSYPDLVAEVKNERALRPAEQKLLTGKQKASLREKIAENKRNLKQAELIAELLENPSFEVLSDEIINLHVKNIKEKDKTKAGQSIKNFNALCSFNDLLNAKVEFAKKLEETIKNLERQLDDGQLELFDQEEVA